MVLIGRRTLRSMNSWLHNVEVLTRGRPECVLHVNDIDAQLLGLVDGRTARVTSTRGSVEVPVVITPDMRPGVVSLPHG